MALMTVLRARGYIAHAHFDGVEKVTWRVIVTGSTQKMEDRLLPIMRGARPS
jgi:hypothetical protein